MTPEKAKLYKTAKIVSECYPYTENEGYVSIEYIGTVFVYMMFSCYMDAEHTKFIGTFRQDELEEFCL